MAALAKPGWLVPRGSGKGVLAPASAAALGAFAGHAEIAQVFASPSRPGPPRSANLMTPLPPGYGCRLPGWRNLLIILALTYRHRCTRTSRHGG
jgi:hypothetical protein